MQKLIIGLIFTLSWIQQVTAETPKKETLDGVTLESSKEDSFRTYQGFIEKKFPFPIEIIKASITNFTDRCNNSHRNMRKYTPEGFNCKHHNDHFIETFVIKNLKPQESHKQFNETYVLGRRAYNRGLLSYHELVQVKEEKQNEKLKSVVITLRMLTDNEIHQFTNPEFKNDSAFDTSLLTFALTATSPNETNLSYTYKATTDHWLLNKEVSVQQVFASISKSLNALFKSIQDEAIYLKSLEQKKD